LEKINYHKTLADYFADKGLYLDVMTEKQPDVRKLVEQPFQQTKAQLWDEVTDTLCDLERAFSFHPQKLVLYPVSPVEYLSENLLAEHTF
jgi:hypothetical protein